MLKLLLTERQHNLIPSTVLNIELRKTRTEIINKQNDTGQGLKNTNVLKIPSLFDLDHPVYLEEEMKDDEVGNENNQNEQEKT